MDDRDFGFIKPEGEGNHDYFLHSNHIVSGSPYEGATVEFDLTKGHDPTKRPMATNAKVTA
jgi:cold shock CspA family protein